MWTERENVISYSNAYLENVTILEIKACIKTMEINLTKKHIENWLTQKRKEDAKANKQSQLFEERYIFNEKDYDLYCKALDVFKNKCLTYCRYLEIIGSSHHANLLIKELDLAMEDGCILTSDLNRILKPLKKNFELAQKLYKHANNEESYLAVLTDSQRKKMMPTSSIINLSKKENDQTIEMTQKQKNARKEKILNLKHEIYSRESDC